MQNLIKPLPLPILTPPPPQSVNTALFSPKGNGLCLTEIDQACSLLSNQIAKPDEFIEGILHAGTKSVLASASKVGKTWILLDLATAIATGAPFLRFKTKRKRVLFINFEIRREFIAERLQIIQERKNRADLSNFAIWNLRGKTSDFELLVEEIIKRVKDGKYELIVLDPIYKAMVGKSENTASSVGVLCNQIERIVEETGAAMIFAHHFSKGNAANKNVIDRMSGSGVFARDADSIITLTEHQEKNCYSAEFTLRNLAPQPPFVIEWKYPVMVERPDLCPSDFKGGEAEQDEYEQLIALLDETPLTTKEWEEAARGAGYAHATFYRRKEVLVEKSRVQINHDKTWSRTQAETSET